MKISNVISENDLTNIKKTGVYKISVNYKKTDNCYIGSTTTSFYLRWIQHLYSLRKKNHVNPILQNIINKHNIACLVFEIIEVVEDFEKIIEIEQHWIDYYDSYKNGYNCVPFAKNAKGRIVKEESKTYKQVSQYSLNGDYITTFKSLKEASEKTNTDYITLSNTCNFKIKTANGFQWRLGNNKEKLKPTRIKKTIKVGQYDDGENLVNEFLSIKEAANYIGRKQNTLSTAIKKGSKIKNYYWKKL